jgi:hypothetical protein
MDHRRERAHQRRRGCPKLRNPLPGEPRENFFAAWGQMQNHLAPVSPGPFPAQELSSFEPVHQLHDAVVAQLQPLGKLADARLAAGGQSAQGQHEQVLLRLEVRVARGFLATVQEDPNLVSEFRKGAKFRGRHRAGGHHMIISLPDINANEFRRTFQTMLDSFAEDFLCFRYGVAQPFVEYMGALPDDIGTHADDPKSSTPRPIFAPLHQQTARAAAPKI